MTTTTSPRPDLVLIDTKTHTYSRFRGKTCTNIVKAEEPMLPEEIELYRTNPAALLPEPAPESA